MALNSAPTTRIRWKMDASHAGRPYLKGEEVTLEKHYGDAIVEAGYAEEVKPVPLFPNKAAPTPVKEEKE